MDTSSQRKILRVSPGCETAQLASEITSAIAGDGPTLGFGQITSEFAPSDIAVVIGTSGSSGQPKEVALTAAALIASARAANGFVGAQVGDTWSLLLPLTHIAGVNVVVRAVELGTLPVDLRDYVGEYPNANFTAIVPTQLFRALNGDARLLKHLKNAKAVLVGGAALTPGLRNQAQAIGIKIVATYGMTETCGGCVYDGNALAGVEFTVSNGLIKLRGKVLAASYLNRPWALKDGWFETSDLGEVINNKLIVIGRSDDVIISGGQNLSLSTIENSLATAFPTLQCVAFAIDEPQWGQALQLAVVGVFDKNEILSHLEKDLGAAAKPKAIHSIASLPLRGIGKVDRAALIREIKFE